MSFVCIFFPTNVKHFFSHMRLTLPPSLSLNHNNDNYHHKLLLFTSFISTFFKPKPKTIMNPPTATTTTSTTPTVINRRRRRKVVVIMGPTGAGKSRLSIDLVTRYFRNAEIINSDKMQVYNGLNRTTNKITEQEQKEVKHHLLGVVNPTRPVFTPLDFRKRGSVKISKMSRRKIPVIVGGSNSFIYSLLTKRFDPGQDVFNGPDPDPVSPELRYDVCFIWVDVCLPVLNNYLSRRVDEMLECGMFDELSGFFRSGEYKKVNQSGLGQAIGVPEFEGYFSKFGKDDDVENSKYEDDVEGYFGKFDERSCEYEEAVRRIKENTCQLAKRQVAKILRLKDGGWDLKRVDATEAFKAVLADGNGNGNGGGSRVSEIWEKHVVEPSMKIVKRFLDE